MDGTRILAQHTLTHTHHQTSTQRLVGLFSKSQTDLDSLAHLQDEYMHLCHGLEVWCGCVCPNAFC